MAINKKGTAKTKSRTRIFVCVIFALAMVLVCAAGGVFARYAVGGSAKRIVSSPQFYFTSDILQETASSYTLNPGAGGTTQISFQVRNFEDGLRVAERNINYNINVFPSDGVTITVNGVQMSSGVLVTGVPGGAVANITVSGLKNGGTYLITATGNAGFVSTLSANVAVKEDVRAIYKHVDNSDPNYLLLTVWTENLSGNVRIEFPWGLIPDQTDSAMGTVINYTGGDYTNGYFVDYANFTRTYSSHVYRFFKTVDANYAAAGFDVSVNGISASEAVPK